MKRLQISYKLGDGWDKISDEIKNILDSYGFKFSGSGAGFGSRDMDFTFTENIDSLIFCNKIYLILEEVEDLVGKDNLELFSVDLVYNWEEDDE
jgi:hypothetical protein